MAGLYHLFKTHDVIAVALEPVEVGDEVIGTGGIRVAVGKGADIVADVVVGQHDQRRP